MLHLATKCRKRRRCAAIRHTEDAVNALADQEVRIVFAVWLAACFGECLVAESVI